MSADPHRRGCDGIPRYMLDGMGGLCYCVVRHMMLLPLSATDPRTMCTRAEALQLARSHRRLRQLRREIDATRMPPSPSTTWNATPP